MRKSIRESASDSRDGRNRRFDEIIWVYVRGCWVVGLSMDSWDASVYSFFAAYSSAVAWCFTLKMLGLRNLAALCWNHVTFIYWTEPSFLLFLQFLLRKNTKIQQEHASSTYRFNSSINQHISSYDCPHTVLCCAVFISKIWECYYSLLPVSKGTDSNW